MKPRTATAVIGLIGVMFSIASPATATISALNACTTKLNTAVRRLVNGKVNLLNKCVSAVVICNATADPDTCIATKATAAGKPCAPDVLDPTNPVTKLGKAIQGFQTK